MFQLPMSTGTRGTEMPFSARKPDTARIRRATAIEKFRSSSDCLAFQEHSTGDPHEKEKMIAFSQFTNFASRSCSPSAMPPCLTRQSRGR